MSKFLFLGLSGERIVKALAPSFKAWGHGSYTIAILPSFVNCLRTLSEFGKGGGGVKNL